MPLDLQPVEETSAPVAVTPAPLPRALDLQPVDATPAGLDLRTPEGETASLMDFMRHADETATAASPVTGGVPQSDATTVQPLSAGVQQPVSAAEMEETLSTPLVEIPEATRAKHGQFIAAATGLGLMGEPGQKAARGLANLEAGAVEFATSPMGALVAGANAVPLLGAAVNAAMTTGMVKGGAAKLGEASVTGDVTQAVEGAGEALFGAAGAVHTGLRTATPAAAESVIPPRVQETLLPAATDTLREIEKQGVGGKASEPAAAPATIESPIRENGGRTSLVLPDGTAIVGGKIHAQTYDEALRTGAATEEQLQGSKSAFTRPDGTSWDLQGNPVPVTRVVNLNEKGVPNASEIGGAAAPVRDVLRSDEGGAEAAQGVPQSIDEGGKGVRPQGEEVARPRVEEQPRVEPPAGEPSPEPTLSEGLDALTVVNELFRKRLDDTITPDEMVRYEAARAVLERRSAARRKAGANAPQEGGPRVEPPAGEPPAEPPTATAAAPEPAVPQLIGIKNARVDEQRAQRGEAPIMGPTRQSDPALWDAAMKRIQEDPGIQERLTRELTERPRPMTAEETVILEHRLVELTHERDTAEWEGIKAGNAMEAARDRQRAATTPEAREAAALEVSEAEARAAHYEGEAGKISDALSAVEEAVGRQTIAEGPGAGTIMARAFRARRFLMRQDFTLAGVERQMRGARGFRSLNEAEKAEAKATSDALRARNAELQRRLKEQVEATAKADAHRELAELKLADARAQAAVTGRIRAIVNKVGSVLDERADRARARLRGKVMSLSPADLKDIAEIAAANLFHIGDDLAKWSARMIEDVGEKVRPHLDELWREARRILDEVARGEQAAEAAATTSAAPRGQRAPKAEKPVDPAAVQEAILRRIRSRIAAYEARIAAGDYSAWRKPVTEMSPEVLRAHYELEQVKKRFYEGLVEAQMARRTRIQRVAGGAVEGVNAMRAVLTSADLSAVLRQGFYIGVAHPLRAASSIGPMLKAFTSERAAFAVDLEIRHRANYPLMRASKLYLAEHGAALSKMEEAYLSRTAAKIPLVGHVVKASERAYITYLNKLRADSFDAMAATLGKNGRVTTEQARILSNYINVATGRGTIMLADQAAAGLNAVFFAPRFVASRFQMIVGQPLYYGLLRGEAPLTGKGALAARALVASEYARILTGVAVVYGLGVAAGADLETDPRSSDFGKLRFGNTRIDLLAGVGQMTVLVAKLKTGEKKSLRTGRIIPLVPPPGGKLKYGSEDLDDTLVKFARYKLAPAPGLAWDYLSGTDAIGNPTTASSLATKALIPISLSDIYATMQEQGVPKGTAIGVLSVFGAGVQNFDANRRR